MTPADWKRVESALAYPYGRAELKCDGRQVVAAVLPAKGLRVENLCDEQRFMNAECRGHQQP